MAEETFQLGQKFTIQIRDRLTNGAPYEKDYRCKITHVNDKKVEYIILEPEVEKQDRPRVESMESFVKQFSAPQSAAIKYFMEN